MRKVFALLTSAMLIFTLVGCQTPQEESSAKVDKVTGTLAYRERIALPKDALVTVTLQDVSLADAPAKTIAKHRFETNGYQVPYEFDLAFHTNKIKPNHRYSVSASIEVNGQLRFITDSTYPVITDSDNTRSVNLMLISVGQ